MVENKHEMLSGRRRNCLKSTSAILAAGLLSALPSFAQDAPVSLAQAGGPPPIGGLSQTAPASERPPSEVSSFVGSLIPGFRFDARVDASETYTTNSYGYYGGANGDDLITEAGLYLGMHEHSRRVSLDATYDGRAFFYARNSQATQVITDIQAVTSVIAIPDYLTFIGRAFAQPVVISNSVFADANGIGSPNGYRNGYGYTVGPDFTFRLGDFASSDLLATYGAVYFANPEGVNPAVVIPGVPGPQDTVMRFFSETLKSGPDFSRLQWTAVGTFSETDNHRGLFSDKSGIVTLQYAITREFALLGTGGYDKISYPTRLSKDISGPVGMGGFAINLEDFSLMAQAGQKYNSLSVEGNLRWDIAPTMALVGVVTDGVNTPEGQLLSNLGGLTASLGGVLTSPANIYANGSTASQSFLNLQGPGSLSFDQNLARYQQATVGLMEDYERNHGNLSLFATKRTQLAGVLVGSGISNSWGGSATYTRDISRLTNASLVAGYTYYDELGGHSKNYYVGGQAGYSLSPQTNVYFRTDYMWRDTSQSFQSLSPFTGSSDDVRLTVGLSHQL